LNHITVKQDKHHWVKGLEHNCSIQTEVGHKDDEIENLQ